MTRDEFREAVFARDGDDCVVCGESGQDAHHLMERRLWADGGYHLDNGVTLCGSCHLDAEKTLLTPWELREHAGITKVVLPEHLHPDELYDKWGNMYMPDQVVRIPGELFYDESVQKVLGLDQLQTFILFTKYPRTPHLPWSPGATDDDLRLDRTRFDRYSDVVITEKIDGENTTMYRDYIHARSLDSKYHQSRTWVKNLHAKIAHEIPPGMRIVGENVFAKHAIAYHDLPSFFLVFSVWDGEVCLSWADTEMWAELLGLHTVPVLWGPGMWLEDDMPRLLQEKPFKPRYSDEIEGYVIRKAGPFVLRDFRRSMAKWVRPNHVTADTQNWFAKDVIPNELA